MNGAENLILDYLSKHGYTGNKQDDYVGAFDLKKPAYLNTHEPADNIYQFVRVASASGPCPPLGNWFCLPGASMKSLSIISGLGRVIAKVEVLFAMELLEGTASPQAIN